MAGDEKNHPRQAPPLALHCMVEKGGVKGLFVNIDALTGRSFCSSSSSHPSQHPAFTIPNTEDRQDRTSHDSGIYLLAFHKADKFRGYVGKTSVTFQERWRRHRSKGVNWKMQALMDRRIDFTPSILLNTQLVPLPYCTSEFVQTQ